CASVTARSHDVVALQLPIITAPTTRSQCRDASISAIQPPIEWPANRARAMPRWSHNRSVSFTIWSTVYGAGGADDGVIPRLSNVTTWYPAATSPGAMPNQPAAGPPHPQINTTGSPSPCTSYASVTSSRSIVAISVLGTGDRGREFDAAVRYPRS